MGNFHHRALMVSASVSAYSAPALMTVCLLTDYWIYGKQTILPLNPTLQTADIRTLNFTYHRIGLWRECIKENYGKQCMSFNKSVAFSSMKICYRCCICL